jgi:hypothetical protein
MMSDPAGVDGTTVDDLTGKLVLLIEEDRAWRETDLMHRQLAAKVKTYVRYTRSPEFAVDHGQQPQGTIVRLVCAQAPSDVSLTFFGRVAHELSKHGLILEHQQGEDGMPIGVTPTADAAVPPRPAQATPPAMEPGPPVAPPSPPLPALEPQGPAPAARPPAEPVLPQVPPPPPLPVEPLPQQAPAPPPPEPIEPAHPGEPAGFDLAPDEDASELEQLIEGGLEGVNFIGFEESEQPAAAPAPPGAQPNGEATIPPFFPEEEFGRALPDVDEVEAIMGMEADSTTAVIETADGKQIRLDAPSELDAAIAAGVPGEQRPSLLRAIGAAFAAAFAGAIIWVLLAIPAKVGASPLALAIAVMVGFSVRVRGGGHTTPFRVVGLLGTVFGSALASVGAAVALTAVETQTGFTGLVEIVRSQTAVLDAYTGHFALIDLISLGLAGYVAFRISASKASS